jgi:YegS/Rv2252/BmrU family lipid kinase
VNALAVVLNASSGAGGGAAAAERLKKVFTAAGRETHITVTTTGAELRAAVEHAVEARCHGLVAGGGDGTLNTAASILVGREIPLGVVPLGTLNHFAKDLGIPQDLEAAAQVVLEGKLCRVDVGEVNGRIFLNNSSLGLYPAIVSLRERYQATGSRKWIAGLRASIAVIRRHPFMTVRIVVEDKEVIRRTPFVLVGNNEYRNVGMQAASRALLDQGRLAVYVLEVERRVGLLRLAWQVVWSGAEQVRDLDLFTVTRARIETKHGRPQVALDGEVVPLESPLEYRVRPRSLLVHVPAATSACTPVPTAPSSSSR